ncbi:MAG: nickel pincer cofactor biosynthesis protein LarC [Myxococcota bacterium]
MSSGERLLYLDCFSGAAGNMILGALLDLGVQARSVREGLQGLGIEGIRMRVERVRRGALAARYVRFSGPRRDSTERRYREIRDLLDRATLPERVRERSQHIFGALARAEAHVHGTGLDEVHFHEVGGIDALGDIVGTCLALESLGVERVVASPLPLGRGTVQTEHGLLPHPAPATLELLRGIPTYPVEQQEETVTPTGAAILAALAERFAPLPAIIADRIGYGAGDDRKGGLPNLVRAVLAEGQPTLETDSIVVLETNLDDMNPEQLPFLVERLLEDGALDVTLTPVLMKKGRPGHLLRVLARPAEREQLARRVLVDSSAIGVRSYEASRLKLPRKSRTVETRYGRVRVKMVVGPNGEVGAAPEYESCRRAARRYDRPIAEIYREAEQAALKAGG